MKDDNLKNAIVNGDIIELSFPYDLATIERVRVIDGRKWNSENKVWEIPKTPWHASTIMDKLSEFLIDPAIIELSKGKQHIPELELPKELYDFQKQGVKFIASTGGRCLLGDDMGLGKTVQALMFLKHYSKKALIVAPANVVYKWRDEEFARWLPEWSVEVIRNGKSKLTKANAIICSYGMLSRRYDEFRSLSFDITVWDECHYLKNPKTQRTRVAKDLVGRSPHVLFISGTPFMNRPGELYPLLNMLDPIGFSNYWTFAKRYCGAFQEGTMTVFPKNGISNTEELASRLSHYMIRRTKEEVSLQLPELTRSYVPVEAENMTDYKNAVLALKMDKTKTSALVKLSKLYQVVGLAKVEPTVELAQNILDAGRKVVIFAHHKSVVEALHAEFKKSGCGVISGDVAAKDRQYWAKQFIDNPKIRVMIITTAGAEGINLYSASDIIFAERDWTPAKEEQAEARLHRIGQKNAVTAYYIVALGTMDEKINATVKDKRAIIGQVLAQDEILENVLNDILKGE